MKRTATGRTSSHAFYYLQSGTWAYYFGGGWTAEAGLAATAFRPGVDAGTAGFYFWPAVPRAMASALTLVIGGAAGWGVFALVERHIAPVLRARQVATDETGVRSVMFALTAFAAFIAFYSFAGAPTLRLVPGLTSVFQVVVLVVATLSLVRRVGRRPGDFAEETLARRILANWRWEDTPPPRDLREAFLIHTIKSRSSEEARGQLVGLYKAAVRDALESGVVSRSDVQRLQSLRDQMHIPESDHERVMTELAEERRAEGLDDLSMSPEKHLQLESYAEALAIHLERRRAEGAALDDAFIRGLQHQYGVTPDEHASAVDRLVRGREGVAAHIVDAPAAVELSAMTAARLAELRSPVARFLVRLLERQWRRAADSLLQIAGGQGDSAGTLRSALMSDDADARASAMSELGANFSPATADRLTRARENACQRMAACLTQADLLSLHLTSADPYLRAAAFYLLESSDEATDDDRRTIAGDEHPVVRDTVERFRALHAGEAVTESSILEKMVGLTSIAILGDLEPEDLSKLAGAGTEVWFRQGEPLCREGEVSDEVFALLDGEVSIVRSIDGTERVLAVEGPGSSIGELAVLDPAPRGATVVASTVAVRALRLSGGAFRAALQSSPTLSDGVIRMLVRRLRRASERSTQTAQP
jgi:hypothetical protein